jgi:flavin-dependent dehydrogenase
VFPRTKLCAGWITPEVVEDLNLDVQAYPHRFNTFDNIVVHLKGFSFKLNSPQHSIRRYEFDDYLLKSCGAEVFHENVKSIDKSNGGYRLNEDFQCDYVIGAGGTRCPIYRSYFREANPRAAHLQVATYEHEFPYPWEDPRCHLWFFEKGLPGYAWYVPKANGYLNCGVGGLAQSLKSRGQDIKTHWSHFTALIESEGLVRNVGYDPRGYSYYLRGNVDVVRVDDAFIVGDSAGLASVDLGEGIGPAVRSGQLAAQSILSGCDYSLDGIGDLSIDVLAPRLGWLRWLIHRWVGSRAPGGAKAAGSTTSGPASA